MRRNKQNIKLLLTIIVLVLFVVFSGFYMSRQQNQQLKAEKEDEALYVGLVQYADHPSLDAISKGIIDTLVENNYIDGENITLDFQNGQGDEGNLNTIANRFVSNDADLMIAIATPAALSLANASSDIPILLGAITDPENVGLIEENEAPGGNITGVSDMTPIDQQLELVTELQPDVEKLGILYSSSEDNSILQGDMAEKLAKEHDLETVTRTVSSTNEVAQVTQQLVTEVDAIWIPNDNMVASAFPSVLEVTNEEQIPVYPAVDTMVAEGGLATLGLNQYQIGVETGEMAVEVLDGDIEPATEPIHFANKTDLVINFEVAEALGIEIPEAAATEAIDASELEEDE